MSQIANDNKIIQKPNFMQKAVFQTGLNKKVYSLKKTNFKYVHKKTENTGRKKYNTQH